MKVASLIKSKPYLCWYVKDKSKISDAAAMEAVLNYGDWNDVKKLFKILGIKKAARIFHEQTGRKRCNYSPRTKNYFTLYFRKYA